MATLVDRSFCAGLDASVPLARWYAFQIFFVSFIVVVAAVLSTLREWNYLEAKHVRWFRAAALSASVLVVLVALSANTAAANRSVEHDEQNVSIPWCGAERYGNCTVYTASVFGSYSRFYGGTCVAICFGLWLAISVAQVLQSPTNLFPWISGVVPNRRRATRAAGLVAEVERLVGAWVSAAVDEYRMEGLLLWWGPGLAVAASVPYGGSPPCLLNRAVTTLSVLSIIHGSLMLACTVGVLTDVAAAWLTNRRHRRYCVTFLGAFTISSALLMTAEILSTSAEPYMWMLWTFSLVYPCVCRVSLDVVDRVVEALMYRSFSGAEFTWGRCQWNLNHRISAYDAALQESGRRPLSLAEALTAIDGALDGWLLSLDLPAIEKQARRDLYTIRGRSGRTRRSSSSNVQSQSAFVSEVRVGVDVECSEWGGEGGGGAPPPLESEELHLVMLMFTCILPIRENNYVDAIFGRLQLFDQLQHTLLKYVHRSADEFEQSVEWKLLPLLSLISRALRCLPTTPQGRGWLENEAGVSTFTMHRYATALDVQRWFVDHTDPLRRAGRHGKSSRRAAPLSFRTFHWGHTDAALPIVAATFNDAVVTVASAPEVHFDFDIKPVGRDDEDEDEDDDEGDGEVTRTNAVTAVEQDEKGDGADPGTGHIVDSLPAGGVASGLKASSMGQCRYLRDIASPSWFEAGRGDVLYCPHARFAIVSVDAISAPSRITITDMTAPPTQTNVADVSSKDRPSPADNRRASQRNSATADDALQFDF